MCIRDRPVAVENDVNAAAAGEFAFGAARDEQDFLMVSYGTGVGGAVYTGGRLYRGRAGSAGAVSYTHLDVYKRQEYVS